MHSVRSYPVWQCQLLYQWVQAGSLCLPTSIRMIAVAYTFEKLFPSRDLNSCRLGLFAGPYNITTSYRHMADWHTIVSISLSHSPPLKFTRHTSPPQYTNTHVTLIIDTLMADWYNIVFVSLAHSPPLTKRVCDSIHTAQDTPLNPNIPTPTSQRTCLDPLDFVWVHLEEKGIRYGFAVTGIISHAPQHMLDCCHTLSCEHDAFHIVAEVWVAYIQHQYAYTYCK